MARVTFRGPAGAVRTCEVPGPGLDQKTFDRRVAVGEFTILADEHPPRPPESGAGSSRAAWADYATTVGVDVPDGASRDDIIELVDNR